jgi:RNA polymerase sigma factor (sigma-70 family)
MNGERGGSQTVAAAPASRVETPVDLESVFREHYGQVFRTAYRITGNAADAEDVLQTIFLRLAGRDAAAERIESMGSYLHRAAVNAALDLMRSRQGACLMPLEEVEPELREDASLAPDREHTSEEIRVWLRNTVARLSPRAAEVFALRFFEGLTNAEIAEALGTSQGTIAVTVHRTRERIEREFRAYIGEKP